MKFKNDVFGDCLSGVAHAMRHARRVEDDIVRGHTFAERFDLTLQCNDGNIVGIDVRFIAGAGEKSGDVAVKFSEAACWPLKNQTRLKALLIP